MSREDFYASPLGAAYSAYMERPRVSSPISRVLWGGDTRPYYASMSAAGEVPAGGVIVDCPCGAGPAMRAIPAEVEYVGVDFSPSMLRRAHERAAVRGLGNAKLVEADATAIPLPPGSADLLFSFWGLHCFPDPAAALLEAARILKPNGRLVAPASFAVRTLCASVSSSAPMSVTSARSSPKLRSSRGSPAPASS